MLGKRWQAGLQLKNNGLLDMSRHVHPWQAHMWRDSAAVMTSANLICSYA